MEIRSRYSLGTTYGKIPLLAIARKPHSKYNPHWTSPVQRARPKSQINGKSIRNELFIDTNITISG